MKNQNFIKGDKIDFLYSDELLDELFQIYQEIFIYVNNSGLDIGDLVV